MRCPPPIYLALFITTASAQQQERSLIDRLLRPNMDLQNPQQGKVFRADSKAVAHTEKPKSFAVDPTAKQKMFAESRIATTKEYRSTSTRADVDGKSFLEARQASVAGQVVSSSVRDVDSAYDANLKVAGRNFADQRSFRGQGKSQKSLDRHNPPLTIDQVRELLNKNK